MSASNLVDITNRNPVESGNVRVTLKRDASRRWRIYLGVYGNLDRCGMRPGRSATLRPEAFGSARDLRHGVGLMAASLAKELDDGVDEVTAYRGATQLLDECMIEMRKRGYA